MEHLIEKFVASKQVFDGKMLKVYSDTVQLPNGKESYRELVRHPGAVAVVPVLNDGRILLVHQYRYPVKAITLEIPAGKLDVGETPDECVLRELEEETGYRAHDIRRVTSILTTPGFTDEVIHIYIARDLHATVQNPDEDEFLEVSAYTKQEVKDMIAEGTINDAKSMIGLLLLGLE